jgi:hypothetical protein
VLFLLRLRIKEAVAKREAFVAAEEGSRLGCGHLRYFMKSQGEMGRKQAGNTLGDVL